MKRSILLLCWIVSFTTGVVIENNAIAQVEMENLEDNEYGFEPDSAFMQPFENMLKQLKLFKNNDYFPSETFHFCAIGPRFGFHKMYFDETNKSTRKYYYRKDFFIYWDADWPNKVAHNKYDYETKCMDYLTFNIDYYSEFLDACSCLENDLKTMHEPQYYSQRMTDIDISIKYLENHINEYSYLTWDNYYPIQSNKSLLQDMINEKKYLITDYESQQVALREKLSIYNKDAAELKQLYQSHYDKLIKKYGNASAYYNRGFLKFSEGDFFSSLSDIRAILSNSQNSELSKVLLLKGQIESSLGLYNEAIISLSNAIKQNPKNREVYFERALAYFELGDFDSSLQDYLNTQKSYTRIPQAMLSFSEGLINGIIRGGREESLEFFPSTLNSLQGLGHGLWAFVKEPAQVSANFVQFSLNCIDFIRTHTPQKIIAKFVPELKVLVENWDTLQNFQKGDTIGYIIGKYGIDIFAGVAIAKGYRTYTEWKNANNLLTLEALSQNKSIITLEAGKRAQIRKSVLQNSNLKIQWDKQGKHVIGHKNYIPSNNKSILAHKNPQKLIDKFSGKGMKYNNIYPGTAGYQEIVNFDEFIGYAVEPATGLKTATTWGKIHYAKDGVHIVPTKPR